MTDKDPRDDRINFRLRIDFDGVKTFFCYLKKKKIAKIYLIILKSIGKRLGSWGKSYLIASNFLIKIGDEIC